MEVTSNGEGGELKEANIDSTTVDGGSAATTSDPSIAGRANGSAAAGAAGGAQSCAPRKTEELGKVTRVS